MYTMIALAKTILTDAQLSTQIVVATAYAIIGYYAYKRFNQLEVDFQRFHLSNNTRTWMTFLRYHIFAFFYFIFLAVCYRVLLNYPGLIEWIMSSHTEWHTIYTNLLTNVHNRELVPPIASLLMLSVLLFRFGIFGEADSKLRKYLQKAGSIPGHTQRLIRMLAKAELDIPDEYVRNSESEILALPHINKTDKNGKDLKAYLLRAEYLFDQISKLDRSDSDFCTFHFNNLIEIETLQTKFEDLQREVSHYYDLNHILLGSHKTSSSDADGQRDDIKEIQNRLIKVFRKNAESHLQDFLWRVYHFFVCAVLSEKKLPNERIESLENFGFKISEVHLKTNDSEAAGRLAEDICLLAIALLLAFSIAIIFGFLCGMNPKSPKKTIVCAWVPMAVLYPTLTSLIVLFIRKNIKSAKRGFWASLGWSRYRRPVQGYIVTGLLSAILCGFALVLIGISDPGKSFLSREKLYELFQWGAYMAFVTAFCLSAFLDNRWNGIKAQITESFILGFVLTLWGLCINYYLLHPGTWPFQADNMGASIFLTTICFLIGAILGFYIPQSYRDRLEIKSGFFSI